MCDYGAAAEAERGDDYSSTEVWLNPWREAANVGCILSYAGQRIRLAPF